MDYLEITVSTASAGIEDVAAALTAAGFDDLVLEDQAEFMEFLDQNRAYWDYIDEELQQKMQGLSCIKLYLEQGDTAGMTRLQTLLDSLKQKDQSGRFGSLAMTAVPLAPVDWEESWKENYPPQPIGDSLVVLPYWLAQEDFEGRKKIILDPGLTFGTGSHPSTKMVIAAMEQTITPGSRCLDLGSGSGILSIAALRLGASSAVGVDIDPKAEDIARENAAYNQFGSDVFTALTGNVLSDKKLMTRLQADTYDTVLVNIVADVIIALSPVLPKLMHRNTTAILSGILDVRLQEVIAALERVGLQIVETRALEDWRCITLRRNEL